MLSPIPASTLEGGHSAAAIFFEMVKINPFSDEQLKTFAGKHIHAHSLDAILAPTLVYAYGVTNDLTIIGRLLSLCVASRLAGRRLRGLRLVRGRLLL